MRLVLALAALLACAGAVAAEPAAGPAPREAPKPIEVAVSTIDHFDSRTPIGGAYDRLIFLGGLQLKSAEPRFGGLSGLRLSADGRRLTAISDRGSWFTGALRYEGSQPVGLDDVVVADTPGRDGRPLQGRKGFDTEGLEIQGRAAWVSSERVNWLTRYRLDEAGRPSGRGEAVALPKLAARAPLNAGFEAIAELRSGALVMIAERFLDLNGDNRAFVVGKSPVAFSVRRTDDFSPTDLARLPDGDFALLERRYVRPLSLSVRVRRLAAADMRDGALVDGPVLMQATLSQAIDNFEGVSAHTGPDGRTVLTLVSDDNFFAFQRTLLMQFALPD